MLDNLRTFGVLVCLVSTLFGKDAEKSWPFAGYIRGNYEASIGLGEHFVW